LLLAGILIGSVGAQLIKEYVIPTTGTVITVNTTVTWLDGSAVNMIDWGGTDNSTEYAMMPFNVTSTSTTPINLTLSTADHSASIISLSLTWNYTGSTLNPNDFVIVELTQNVTATGSYSYDTIIIGEQS